MQYKKTFFTLVFVFYVFHGAFSCDVTLAIQQPAKDDKVSFGADVKPILSNHCFYCHGPDRKHREAGLRLDIADEAEWDEVMDRITSEDESDLMPPPHANKPLNAQQIETIRKWIDQGASYESHWAFVKPLVVDAPEVEKNDWSQLPLDRFVLAKLRDKKLAPNDAADRRTLIRRVTLDLTGLPPSPEEIRKFLAENGDDAYEKLVDRLLARPQYGEHMAKYWLDLVRFADTNGLHHDHFRQMTPYRDWVIRAFNDNLGFDEFITDQIAGDLHAEPSTDQLIASGFNRLHLIIDRGTALPEESFNRNVVDRVTAVGTAFMGLTVQCAQCHDHKYDPIRQKDFYQLYAFFNNFDGGPETGGRNGNDFQRGLQQPYINLPNDAQKASLQKLETEIESLDKTIREKQRQLKKNADSESPNADLRQSIEIQLKDLTARLEKTRNQRNSILLDVPAALVMKEHSVPRTAHIHVRGAYDQLGEVVQRDTPKFLPPMKQTSDPKSRMDLARWLVDGENPLTSRVAVNRFWQQFFGVGIVKTSEDFGAQGEVPTHAELLDYLAIRFVRSGWDVKKLVRTIVLSKTYRQSSKASIEDYRSDPENRWLSRGSRFRMDAEMLRDQILAVSGLLNRKMYGKSVKPPQPKGLWEIVAMPSSYPRVYQPDKGDSIYRRSVYTFWKRALPPPQMTIFDAPTRESCIARRERTNTPLQALLLMNETQFFEAAMCFADRLIDRKDLSDSKKIEYAWERITGQEIDHVKTQLLESALAQFRAEYQADVTSAEQMFSRTNVLPKADLSKMSSKDRIELASWTMLVHSMFNLDQTKTRE